MTDSNRRKTFRDHAEASLKTLANSRSYAADNSAVDALAALASVWQEKRAAEDIGFSREDFSAFLSDLSKHLPQLVQQKPSADEPAVTPVVWTDSVTNATARNPFEGDADVQDVASQVAVTKHDPALAAHLQRLAKDGGVSYKYLVELREAEAKRQRRASFVYGATEHAANPWRDPKKLTKQSKLMTEDRELAEFLKEEAKPLTLPWQPGHKNLTLMSKLSVADPTLGPLVRQAEATLEVWTRDELAHARQAEEQARAARVAAEMRLAPPSPKQ